MTLIERLEKAEAGSRELDAEIATACGIEWSPDEDGNYGAYGIMPRRCCFTRSIDAADSLRPKDYRFRAWHHVSGDYGCDLFPANGGSQPIYRATGAKTEALARCIAALKARSTP